ncbi:MAG: hypothetical protein OQK94_08955 [Gammaproteobacteria bacterium]|nr:hypothetical protein [Gammaproteobacteria bacterium]MCW8840863.1 hypothetical protein [Gammaproteobacteria bacterium]MCW8928471.1 hypothetical protein [Gammaproteobacteria bacterium]MCW8957573.1 hypothetical protein [Gammaproteobacteria bacterium]MCW8972864.1 hypothetical protein [Gammaproteobacteria bacterium]
MNGLENAQHDLSDAQFSLETAIDLLSSIDTDIDTQGSELQSVIEHLQRLRSELADSFRKLHDITSRVEL